MNWAFIMIEGVHATSDSQCMKLEVGRLTSLAIVASDLEERHGVSRPPLRVSLSGRFMRPSSKDGDIDELSDGVL